MKREERRGKDTNGDVKTAEKGEVKIREKKETLRVAFHEEAENNLKTNSGHALEQRGSCVPKAVSKKEQKQLKKKKGGETERERKEGQENASKKRENKRRLKQLHSFSIKRTEFSTSSHLSFRFPSFSLKIATYQKERQRFNHLL